MSSRIQLHGNENTKRVEKIGQKIGLPIIVIAPSHTTHQQAGFQIPIWIWSWSWLALPDEDVGGQSSGVFLLFLRKRKPKLHCQPPDINRMEIIMSCAVRALPTRGRGAPAPANLHLCTFAPVPTINNTDGAISFWPADEPPECLATSLFGA